MGWFDRDVSEVSLIGRARRIRPAFLGVSWLIALEPAPCEPWIDAFSGHQWDGPLPLQLQPPSIVCVDGVTGVGLRDGHVDGSIAPYVHVCASVEAAVARANAVALGRALPPQRNRTAERAVRRMLREPGRSGPLRPPGPTA